MHGTQCMFSKLLQDVYGDTALIQACRDGFIETARVLLDHGANVDHQNNVSNKCDDFKKHGLVNSYLIGYIHSKVIPKYVE